MVTLLQSVLFQLLTWMLIKPDELYFAIGFALVFVLPILVSLTFWVMAIIDTEITERNILYRIMSWTTTEASLLFNLMFLVVLSSLKVLERNYDFGLLFLIFCFVAIIPFEIVIKRIINVYKKSTPDLLVWSNWKGKLLPYIMYYFDLIFLVGLLWYMAIY